GDPRPIDVPGQLHCHQPEPARWVVRGLRLDRHPADRRTLPDSDTERERDAESVAIRDAVAVTEPDPDVQSPWLNRLRCAAFRPRRRVLVPATGLRCPRMRRASWRAGGVRPR